MLNLMRKFVLAALLATCATAIAPATPPATEKKSDWDDDSLDDLIAIAKTFRKKQQSDGSLEARHAKSFQAMLKQAGKSKAPLPVVMELLDELWATKSKDVDTPRYASLTPQSFQLVKESMVYLGRLGKDGDKAMPCVLRVLTMRKNVTGTAALSIPGRWVDATITGDFYTPGYYAPAYTTTTTTQTDAGELRFCAALALGRMGAAKAHDPLLAALKGDTDGKVRKAAVVALCQVSGVKAMPALLKTLADDKDNNVRLEAAYNLGIMGSKELQNLDDRKKLYKKLKAEADSQDDAKVVAAIRKAMTTIRNGAE